MQFPLSHWPRVWGPQPAPSLSHHTRNCSIMIPHQPECACNQATSHLQSSSSHHNLLQHVRWPVTYTLHQVPGSTSGNITGILLECVYFTIFLNKCCEGKEGSTCSGSVSIAGSIEPVRQINHYRRHSQYFYCQVDHLPILNLCLIFWFPCQCWHTEYFLNQKI